MIENIIGGLRGYSIWKKITREYDLARDNFFFVYPGEEHLIKYSNKYLYSYMYEFKAVRCIFITVVPEIEREIFECFKDNPNIDVKVVTNKEAKYLLMAYWFKVLGDKILIISLKNLYGRRLENLIGINDITEEELMVAALLNLKVKKIGGKLENRTKWSFRVRT